MMKKLLLAGACLFLFKAGVEAQSATGTPTPERKKGTFYITWGYNKDYFSKSDLHFKNTGSEKYDFTLYDVKAKDRPGFRHILHANISIPQYVYRLGYYFNDAKDLGVEINFDHTKYVVIDDQRLKLKGYIHGTYYDTDTLVTSEQLLHFEHTNGGNFLMVNGLRRFNLLKTANRKHMFGIVAKAGAGIVIPKTDVTLFGERLDNKFHIAGYLAGVDIGFRYDFFKYFFLEGSGKGVFANYTDVLVIGTGKAHHYFWTGEIILAAGFQFPL
jgi:hypothetical protein